MRYLTIKCKKSFVACLAAMKVYIEDPAAGDLTINGIRCRKLGTLKNGEKGNFRISEAPAKVFVIADQFSEEFCNDFYLLPAGQESITLSGRCRLNPAAGNPFRFSRVDKEKDLKRRKRGFLIAGIAALVLVAACVVAGIVASSAKPAVGEPHTYYIDDMQITLTQDFAEFDAQGYERAFDSEHVALMILQEEFTLMEGLADYTLVEYGELVLANNPNTNNSGLCMENGVLYFEYQKANQEDGDNYHYIVTMYKGPDAFWLVQYIVNADEAAKYRDHIFDWAASVKFDE